MNASRHFDIWLLGLAGLGLLISISLFPQTYPQAGARGTKSRHDIIRQAETVLDQIQFPRAGLEPTVDFRPNHELLAFGQANFGLSEANRIFSQEVPAYFWNVRFGKPSWLDLLMNSPRSEEQIEKAIEQHRIGEARLQLDLHGRLLAFDLNVQDESDTVALDLKAAQAVAFRLFPFSPLGDTSELVLEKSQMIKQKKRVDHVLQWKTPAPLVGMKARLEVMIQGAKVRHWRLQYTPIAAVYSPSMAFRIINKSLAGLLLIVSVVIFFFRKLRADEMSLKAGLPAAIAAAIGFDLMYITDTTITLVGQLASAILLPGFFILFYAILYGTGESLMRNLGQNRLLSFEAAQHGRWQFQPVGEGLSRGAAFGLILFGGVTIILNRVGPLVQTYFELRTENEALVYYTSILPPLSVLGQNLGYVLFAETAYRLFLVSMLSRFFRRVWVIAGIAAFISALWPIPVFDLGPYSFSFAINFLLGLALTLIYQRFDFFTTVTAALSLPLLLHGFGFLHTGKIVHPIHGWILLALPVLFIAGGWLIRRFGKSEIDTRALQPDYLGRLAEKERVKRELEIARQVQLSFLPRKIPQPTGLDIAAVCIPANEVGGDYYDFVQLGDDRLGVLIGDVSGKGISAAFYMTLTKGIIKSSVQGSLPPAQVLTHANQLFCENVERGIFVSLIYAVFDLPNRIFTTARAGHNPIMLLRRQPPDAILVSPKGLALGLENGELFGRNIQEQSLVINSGDVFVLYTDGFTEAMNDRNEEFGEDRMIEVLTNDTGASSRDTITIVRQAVQRFTGNAPQHDDMTMVVVRVL